MSDIQVQKAPVDMSSSETRAAARVVTSRRNERPRVRIILEETENMPPTGQPFGVNGRCYILKPGVEADVPASIVDILEHAKVKVPRKDPVTMQIIGYTERHRFPYRVMSKPVEPIAA